MGACFNYKIVDLPDDPTTKDVERMWGAIVSDCLHMHGNDGYNGTFSTCSGVSYPRKHFNSHADAYSWLTDNTSKWGNAAVVSFNRVETVRTQEPTFEGKTKQEHGGGRYMYDHEIGQIKTLLHVGFKEQGTLKRIKCDQLTELQDEALYKLFKQFADARDEHNLLAREWKTLIKNADDYLNNLEFSDWARLKQLRKALPKARSKYTKLHEKLVKKDDTYSRKLIKTKQVDHGKQWLLGGWCAE